MVDRRDARLVALELLLKLGLAALLLSPSVDGLFFVPRLRCRAT
jgi:hypothetical protein